MPEPTYSPDRLRNTNRLVRLIYSRVIALENRQPSASELYGLAKLAWITKGDSTDTYITGAKIPALEHCLGLPAGKYNEQKRNEELSEFADRHFNYLGKVKKKIILSNSGFVNIYGPYRNSAKEWIEEYIKEIRSLFKSAYELNRNDNQKRLKIYNDIGMLPKIPSGGIGAKSLSPANLVTPVIFCLDRHLLSPVINGSEINKAHLKNIGASLLDLSDCASRMIEEIDQNEQYIDAADLDFSIQMGILNLKKHADEGKRLCIKDDKDIEVIVKGGKRNAKQLHNALTNELIDYLGPIVLKDGNRQVCMFDALIPKDQMARDRHLLIEVKNSGEIPNIRLAIGQLLHYKYNLSGQYSDPELAILVPDKPEEDIIKFLTELDIYTIWGRDANWNITGRNINEIELKKFLNDTN